MQPPLRSLPYEKAPWIMANFYTGLFALIFGVAIALAFIGGIKVGSGS